MVGKKMIEWLLISIAIVVGLLVVVLFWKMKKGGPYEEPNYYIFYIMGIVLLFIGLGFMVISLLLDYSFIFFIPIFTIGVVYLAIGLSHKNTWKNN